MGYVMLDTPNQYTAQGTFPRRGGAKLSGTVILHTTEGNWTSGVASLTGLVKTRSDYGCYHQACDWADIVKYYPWEWECWQDSETNNWAVGISAACKTSDWAIMPANIREGYYRNMAHMAADFVRYMAGKGITVPLRRITGAQARARVPGFCAHGDSGIARSDPGAAFDWALFFRYTQQALNNGGTLANSGTTTKEPFTMEQFKVITDKLDSLAKVQGNTYEGIWNGGVNKGKTFNYGILPIVVHNQTLIGQLQAQLGGLIGALNAVAKGEPFDEAKLLASITAASEAGAEKALSNLRLTNEKETA